jgi:hypothetical protein
MENNEAQYVDQKGNLMKQIIFEFDQQKTIINVIL